MQEETSTRELKDRLALIETMMTEGRRATESWGWVFVLWGAAYCVAVGWANWGDGASIWGHSRFAWPVTMFGTAALTLAIGLRGGKGQPSTAVTRAVVSAWLAVGFFMLAIFPALAASGRLDQHLFVTVVAGMLGVANAASGMILRWKMQLACAVVWWIASIAACFGSDAQLMVVFLSAVFLCQIVFGVYAMMLESRRRKERVIVHA